jgi:hypothetical protein
MKTKLVLIAIFSFLVVETGRSQFYQKIVPSMLRAESKLDEFLGKRIVIIGKVSQTKIPTIDGIDVRTPSDFSIHQVYQASGFLKKSEVTDDMVKEMNAQGIAHRGAGVFYRIVDPETGEVAEIKRFEPISTKPPA